MINTPRKNYTYTYIDNNYKIIKFIYTIYVVFSWDKIIVNCLIQIYELAVGYIPLYVVLG